LNSSRQIPKIVPPTKIDKLSNPTNENNIEISFLTNIEREGFKRKPIPDIETR